MSNKVNLSPKNAAMLRDFAAAGSQAGKVEGTKLLAVLKLIDKKGEIVTTEHKDLQGLKALEIGHLQWLACKVERVFSDKPFPCMLKTYNLVAEV